MFNAKEIVIALKGRWHGSYGMARCPAHDDRTPSLSVTEREERVLFRCHAGCDQDAVVDALQRRGLFEKKGKHNSNWPPIIRKRPRESWKKKYYDDADSRREAATRMWKQTQPIGGTLGEKYLRYRDITIKLPPSLRYAKLKHSDTGLILPTLVAVVQDVNGKLCGIHRTFLRPDGTGKADVPPKQQKKALGPIAAGTVHLSPSDETVALAEGIEDGLAVQQMTGQATLVCLGTSGFKNFQPPRSIRRVILAPDADKSGDEAIDAAAPRLAEMGLEVRIVRPPSGKDWCDMLVDFEERAAIREIDGEQDREAAEETAWAEVLGGLI